MLGLAITTVFSPATSFARAIASSTPS